MSAFIETLASYVPKLITSRLAANPTLLTLPISEHFPAAVLFADISGFTALTEHLAQQGPAGAEILTYELNTYFGRLIELIMSHGGDVVKFAGDALTAIWPVSPDTTLAAATRRAATCALAIQKAVQNYQTTQGHKLAVRMGLGAGDVAVMHLGGIYGRWEFVITGQPLSQVGQAEAYAQPGEVIASIEAWALLQAHSIGQPSLYGYVRLERIEPTLAPPRKDDQVLYSEIETPLRGYIPGAILARLSAGQSGWLAELRRVTVLFINLPGLTYDTPTDQAQAVIQALQTALYRYEGSINRITIDDKGPMLLAALGLPPLAHEDDAARGVQAALAMHTALRDLGWHCAIGITTGTVFCGSVGNTVRREYTMMGDVVNLAARLMQAAGAAADREQSAPILCDETTYQAAQGQIVFETLTPIQVKGKTKPISIYRPIAAEKPLQKPTNEIQNRQAKIEPVGRSVERMLLADKLQKLQRGHSGVVIIEGEAGIGKSRLVADLITRAEAMGVPSLVGAGDAIEKCATYHAWQPIFLPLFNMPNGLETQTAFVHLQDYMTQLDPALAEQTPLLSAVVPFDFPDNEVTKQLQGKIRAEKTRSLLVWILAGAIERKNGQTTSLLLVIEDAHWLDSASWALLQQVQQEVKPLLLVIATRLIFDTQVDLPTEYRQLLTDPQTQHIKLTALAVEDILTLVCQRLGVTDLPQPVADLILDKAEGHPFFSEELAYALRDAGLIEIVAGQCSLAAGVNDLSRRGFPDTLQSVITSRIDRLSPPQQLAVKVASVIGRVFAFQILHEVYPIEADKLALPLYLKTLAQLDLTPLKSPEPDLAYFFKHVITQEVAYNLMAFSQRRQLHQAVAEWYERTHSGQLSPFFPILAYHWRIVAEDQQADPTTIAKAVEYLHKAGRQAVHRSANAEAIRHLKLAVELLATLPETIERDRQELTLQLALSHPLMAAQGYSAPETVQTISRACLLAERLGDTDHIFPLLYGQWVNHYVRSDHREAQKIGAQFLALAEQQADSNHILLGHRLMGFNLIAMGEFQPGYRHLEQVLTLYDPAQHQSMAFRYGQDPGITAQVLLAVALVCLGYPDQALRRSQQAIAMAQDLKHANTLGYVLAHACLVYQVRRDVESVAASVQTLFTLCQEQSLPLWLGIATSMEGWVMIQREQTEAGVARLRRARADLLATGSRLFLPHLSVWLAEGYIALGQMAEALTLITEALTFTSQTDSRWWEAELYRLKGELLLKDRNRTLLVQDEPPAEVYFLKAIELARQQKAKSWQLRATISQARLWQTQGRHADARQILAEIYDWFTEGFDTGDLRQAKALLETL